MGLGLSAALGVGSLVANKIGGRGAKKARANMGAAIARYRAYRPTGYLTPEDLAQAGRVRQGYADVGRASAGFRGAAAIARARQLGYGSGQPGILQREQGRIAEDQAQTNMLGNRAADTQLYDTSMSREQAMRDQERTAFGAEMGLYENDLRRGDAQHSAFMNGLNDFLPTLAGFYGGGGLPNSALSDAAQNASTAGPDLQPRPVTP